MKTTIHCDGCGDDFSTNEATGSLVYCPACGYTSMVPEGAGGGETQWLAKAAMWLLAIGLVVALKVLA